MPPSPPPPPNKIWHTYDHGCPVYPSAWPSPPPRNEIVHDYPLRYLAPADRGYSSYFRTLPPPLPLPPPPRRRRRRPAAARTEAALP